MRVPTHLGRHRQQLLIRKARAFIIGLVLALLVPSLGASAHQLDDRLCQERVVEDYSQPLVAMPGDRSPTRASFLSRDVHVEEIGATDVFVVGDPLGYRL